MRAPTYEERLAAMKARDDLLCGCCAHKCVSHGSLDNNGEFVGTGRAACGIDGCGCPQFADT